MTRKLVAPRGLQVKGKRLWNDITANYELRFDELRLLEDVCREVDLIERLETALMDAPLTVKGSMGQEVASPLVQEIRQHRGVVARLLSALKLPDESGSQSNEIGSSARAAAMARWGRRGS